STRGGPRGTCGRGRGHPGGGTGPGRRSIVSGPGFLRGVTMADAMTQRYQQVILDHARERHGYPLAEAGDGESFQVNPTCGDEIRLRVHLDTSRERPRIGAVSWEGVGCSISQASASVMTDLLTGVSVAEADDLAQMFRALVGNRGHEARRAVARKLGDAAAFSGVARFPARIKCALRGWMALRDALPHALTSPPSSMDRNITEEREEP